MPLSIKGKLTGEIECKRFYLSGLDITAICPKCNNHNVVDNGTYISYPEMNEGNKVYLSCSCGHEWTEEIVLNVLVTIE